MNIINPINLEILTLLSVPIIAALVGWTTNWVAIKLMFYPLDFFGYKPLRLGWQGVIPSKSEKMAKVIVEKGLKSITDISEMYGMIDKDVLADQLEKLLGTHLDVFIDEIMSAESRSLWEGLPHEIQQALFKRCHERIPGSVQQSIKKIGDNIEGVVDFETMVVDILAKNKSLLNEFFLEAGEREFKFIINSGLYLGFAFGLVQMLVWYYLSTWWVLPIFGFIVGLATNSIALKVIFSPIRPFKFGPFTIQGLFIKRQRAVSEVLSRITSAKLLTLNNIFSAMLNGPKEKRTKKLLSLEVRQSIDVAAGWGMGIGKYITLSIIGVDEYTKLKLNAVDLTNDYLEDCINTYDLSQQHSPVIRELLRKRMEQLSPEEFCEVLRPAFHEDEWKLILIGAVLGVTAGIAQLLVFYSNMLH